MADFQIVKSHLDSHNLYYYSFFFPKSEKPIKVVICNLAQTTPAGDISDGLVSLGFDVLSVKQMTATRRSSPEESKVILPLFLVTLPRMAKSQEIFCLPSPCHIAIRVETYRAPNALTQCHNCQQFGHIWANCKQPPRCLWCGGEHMHKDCPEKGNTTSTPTCCNCQLVERERKLIPQITAAADMRRNSYRSGSHKEHPRLQQEGLSPQISPPQVSPSRRRSEAAHSSNNNLRYSKFQWQVHP
jgi:hypothetical protein